ncbi:MAG TPA: GNAT family N-acetyltransferase [Armatimonadota bacterium]
MAAVERLPAVKAFRWRDHLARVLEFQYEVYERNFPGFRVDGEFLADYERQLRQAVRSPFEGIWVLEDGGEVFGFIWAAVIATLVDDRLGYVKNLYVAPEARGQGWGARLLTCAEDWMRALGVGRTSLDVTVVNETAVSLYERSGYHISRYRMEKDL